MDASALASALDNLEKSWLSLDWWLNFWTILVVVGVAVELAVLIAEYMHDWREFRRGTIHSPNKPSLIVFGLGFLGAGLVATGVAGELRIHIEAGKIETDIRDTTRKLVALVDKETARLTGENLKLRAALAGRELTIEQQKDIHAAVKQFSGNSLAIASYPNEPESARLVAELKSALDPPIRVDDKTGHLEATWNNTSTLFGIRVLPGSEAERKFAEALVVILRDKGGLTVEPVDPSGAGGGITQIDVGLKPPVILPKP